MWSVSSSADNSNRTTNDQRETCDPRGDYLLGPNVRNKAGSRQGQGRDKAGSGQCRQVWVSTDSSQPARVKSSRQKDPVHRRRWWRHPGCQYPGCSQRSKDAWPQLTPPPSAPPTPPPPAHNPTCCWVDAC